MYVQHQLARTYILGGDHSGALDVIEKLLSRPHEPWAGRLRINPNFAPLRGNPRFEKLIAQ